MERVVTINLNGIAYQLDESAYDALRAYLNGAEAALADNPDKAEVVRDLEQAIADKAGAYLSAHKNVVSGDEMTRILAEMGPVEGSPGAADQSGGARSSGDAPRRRLYRVPEGAAIAGVCSGIGAYFDLDANLIRLLFILAALFSGGFAILVYIVLMFVIPSAQTSAEWAAAHGAPFNAQEVIDRAKREYRSMAEDASRSWRSEHRAWRRAMRERMHAWGRGFDGGMAAQPVQPAGYVTRIVAGLFAFVLSVVAGALLVAFLIALVSLLNTGAVLGWHPPEAFPTWLAIVIVCVAYVAFASPLRHLRHSAYATASGTRYASGAADDLITLLAVVAGGVIAYHLVPEFRDLLQNLPDAWANFLALLE